jgi:bacteriorhodopsin
MERRIKFRRLLPERRKPPRSVFRLAILVIIVLWLMYYLLRIAQSG